MDCAVLDLVGAVDSILIVCVGASLWADVLSSKLVISVVSGRFVTVVGSGDGHIVVNISCNKNIMNEGNCVNRTMGDNGSLHETLSYHYYRPRSKGDNVLGTVRPSVRPLTAELFDLRP